MEYVRLGKTNLLISRTAFGAQSLKDTGSEDNAAALVRQAYNAGINFFDTSRTKPESEKLLGYSLRDIRQNIFLATKTSAQSVHELLSNLDESLTAMQTDTVDLYQFESDTTVPLLGGPDGVYAALVDLKAEGKIKHIGFATQDFDTAKAAVQCGLYETLQFPFSMISPDDTAELVKLCDANDTGFIAMQPLCGGILSNIPLAFGFLHQYENVVPIWGALSSEELEQILYFNDHPPVIDDQFKADVEKIRDFFN